MAQRTRVIYNMLGVAVSTGATTYNFSSGNSGINTLTGLERIQSFSYNFNVNRTPVFEYGQFDALTRVITSPPTVTADTSWIVADLANEKNLGFYVSGDQSCIKDFLNQTKDSRNLFLAQAPDGTDEIGYNNGSNQSQVTQINNAVIASWSTQAAVGGLPTTSVNWSAFNWSSNTGSSGQLVTAIDTSTSAEVSNILYTIPVFTTGLQGAYAAIRPSDIELVFANPSIGYSATSLHPQSYNLSFSLNRQTLTELSSLYPYLIAIGPGVTLTATFEFNYGDLTTGDLNGLQCNDPGSQFYVNLYNPTCPPFSQIAAQYKVVGAQIDTQGIQSNVSNAASTLSLTYSVLLGAGGASTNGFFMSGLC